MDIVCRPSLWMAAAINGLWVRVLMKEKMIFFQGKQVTISIASKRGG